MAYDALRPDIQAAADRMETKFGARREIRKLAGYLREGEFVQYLAGGFYGGGLGLLALTGERLLFVRDGWVNKASEDFPIDKITSVEWRSGFSQGTLTVHASGNRAELKQIYNPDGSRIAEAIRNRQTSPPPAPAPQASPLPQEQCIGDQLTKLWHLVQAGAMSQAEFEVAKAQLLGPISVRTTIPGHAPNGVPPQHGYR
ncbi:PH domain-containing protein [Nonomuraea sp. CA-218870]|uniref:PH domain-containing protein n=1 Tax=Nonomuraea sp. CA-218870 TaxID=3239998 RepID=UPI003D8B6190